MRLFCVQTDRYNPYIYKLPSISLVERNPVEIVKVQIINVQDCSNMNNFLLKFQ